MTRDNHRIVDDHDGKADVFSALWTAASSLPQLPSDASEELRNLTIDVGDPKKVYCIYQASRRHGFQVLVEKYISQLRYGCQDPYCNKPTCFTCRKRLAGATPIRRYNATSARTLACHLATQDNPEKGLCQHGENTSPKLRPHSRLRVSSKSTSYQESAQDVLGVAKSSKVSSSNIGGVLGLASHTGVGSNVQPRRRTTSKTSKVESSMVNERDDLQRIRSVVDSLEAPTKKDHRSFVQNLFGTVALRMVEWLTPKSLEAMTATQPNIEDSSEEKPDTESSNSCKAEGQTSCETPHSDQIPGPISSDELKASTGISGTGSTEPSLESLCRTSSDSNNKVTDFDLDNTDMGRKPIPIARRHNRHQDPGLTATSQPIHPIRHVNDLPVFDIKDKSTVELAAVKPVHVHGQSTQADEHDSQKPTLPGNQGINAIKKPRKRITSLTSSKSPTSPGEDFPYHSGTIPSAPNNTKPVALSIPPSLSGDDDLKLITPARIDADHIQQSAQPETINSSASCTGSIACPQSLRCLSVGVIDNLSNISDSLETRDGKALQRLPPYPKEGLQGTGSRNNRSGALRVPPSTSSQWKLFIEQSLFFVMSSPDALIKSFTDEKNLLIDTQTLWYCMTRLMRTNSALLYDSLWIAAAQLYSPPQEVWPIHDWSRRNIASGTDGGASFATEEAAMLMSICLHALVAAVPYVRNAAELYDISRARAYGLSNVPGRGTLPTSVETFLQVDDVFSDELALRLARRIFAAIPARRHFQDMLRSNMVGGTGRCLVPDILDIVLAPLNFLDFEAPRILDFAEVDRERHERVLPTLLIDWARTVMLQDWTGQPEIVSDGAFGGALAMISAMYEKRKLLLLGDAHFRTEYFSDRLDFMEMPVEWLSFTTNKKTLHLLDYPYLFSPASLVTYFRAINFSRMSRSFEAASSMHSRIRNTSDAILIDPARREDLFERLKTAHSKFLVLNIRREDVLVDAFNLLWRREERELLRPLKIRLGEDSGEEGFDSGGVQQEFFRLAIAEALDPDYGAFTIDQRTQMTWFRPGTPEPLWKFELIGLIVSLAVYNGLTLPVTFPKALYRKLLGVPVTELLHIEDGWPELSSSLTTLLEWDEEKGSVTDVFCRTYEFTVDLFGLQVSRDMIAGKRWPQFHDSKEPNPDDAALVTGENRDEYVNDYIRWLTDVSIRPQFEAFQRGFLTCLDRRSLSLLQPDILQSVVEGVQEIDISELRRYTRYIGWDASHQTIKDFWFIVRKYGLEEKKKLLEFVTASDRVPVGGMKNLAFVIQRNGVGDVDGRLPTSYTCYGTLLLPEYSSREILKEKVGMALKNAKGFGFA